MNHVAHRVLRAVLAVACFGAFTIGFAASPAPADVRGPWPSGPPAPSLRLVSARDHLPAGFTHAHGIWADNERIYLAGVPAPKSFPGALFILGRDRRRNFPLLQTITDPNGAFPTGVRGARGHVFVTWSDGTLRVYSSTHRQIRLERSVRVSDISLSDLAQYGETLYVGVGQAQVAVNATSVVMHGLNSGEVVREVDTRTWTIGRTFGDPLQEGKTVVFDRATGVERGSWNFLPDVLGTPQPGNLYADNWIIAETAGGGCCSSGIQPRHASTLEPYPFVPELHTNVVIRRRNVLVAGTERGTVALRSLPSGKLLADLDLRALTGHTGVEDIEIRSLWIDWRDGLIFAGSSWGNDQSRSPELPSFFVLETVPAGSR